MEDVYANPPLSYQDGIPIFSSRSQYTENYETIAADHLNVFERDGINPFIPEDLWVTLEKSTIEQVEKYARDGDMILDAGVGLGRILSSFPKLKRYGMDISLKYLKLAQTKGIKVCCSLIEDMPYKEETFDIIVCADVLEHVLDLNFCCKRVLSVLKTGGILIIRVPFREDLALYTALDYPYRFAHLRYFDEHSLHLLFERIFECRVLEWATSGYAIGQRRLKIRLPRGGGLLVLLFRYFERLKSFYPGLYRAVREILFYPTEINMVIRKK